MRRIYLTSLVLLFGFSFANAQEIADATQEIIEVVEVKEPEIQLNWETSYDEAIKRAKLEKETFTNLLYRL